jgi:membrane-bound inhibitor of C-type lysozyme
MRIALFAATMVLTACGQKAEEAPKEAAPAAPVPPSLAKASQSVAFTCDRDTPVTAIYGTNAEGKADVALIVQGQSFTLDEAASKESARYTTPYGLEAGMGLAWVVTGETALLQQAPVDRIADPAAGQTIRTCKVKGENDAP